MSKTIRELLEMANKEIQVMVGQKMSCNEFHHQVQKLTNKVTLREGLEARTWKLCVKDEFRELANLNLDSIDDKRTKYNPQWRVVSLKYEIINEDILDLTVKEAEKYFIRKRKEEYIEGCNKGIKEAYEHIKEMEEKREQLKKELAEM